MNKLTQTEMDVLCREVYDKFAWKGAAVLMREVAIAMQSAMQARQTQVDWVVNSDSDLGVRVNGSYHFLFKGKSIVFAEDKAASMVSPFKVRPVGKREFGECCKPVNGRYASLQDGEEWFDMYPTDTKVDA